MTTTSFKHEQAGIRYVIHVAAKFAILYDTSSDEMYRLKLKWEEFLNVVGRSLSGGKQSLWSSYATSLLFATRMQTKRLAAYGSVMQF